MTFVPTSTSSVGVYSAVWISGLVSFIAPIVPLPTVTSSAANPVGASEKVKVTVVVSPTLNV